MSKIQENVSLAQFTTFNIGGPARFFVAAESVGDLVDGLMHAAQHGLPVFVLGGGSNIVFPDEGLAGVVIKMDIGGTVFEEDGGHVLLTAGAGHNWDDVVGQAVERGLGGIENLSLIPGTVGGAVYQNIGAYGAELKDVLASVQVVDVHSNQLRNLTAEQCKFDYRDSIFKHPAGKHYAIIGATVRLSKTPELNIGYPDVIRYFEGRDTDTLTLGQVRRAVTEIRRNKLPYPEDIGNAGSFFKNPIISVARFNKLGVQYPDVRGRNIGTKFIKLSAAQLIERAGWKGRRVGDVGVSDKHALVLVNYGHGTAKAILDLAGQISADVKDKFGVVLEPEVQIIKA